MNIYFLTDGISEEFRKGETTLELTNHPNLDSICSRGYIGLYEPSRRPFLPNPETYVIYPFFFGLKPENNPGRAGLELIGEGVDIEKFPNLFIYRIISKDYDVRKGWDKAPRVQNEEEVFKVIEMMKEEFKETTRTIKSTIGSKGNIWCVGSNGKESLEDYINWLQFEISKLGYNCYPALFQDYISGHSEVKRPTTLYGWSKGSLPQALKMVGVKLNQTIDIDEIDMFNYPKKTKDFKERILPLLKIKQDKDESAIIFIKETSNASRKRTRQEKINAIGFIDNMIGFTLEEMGGNTNIIVLSDHQSNIGIERTYQGPTNYGYARIKDKPSRQIRFTERLAWGETQEIKTQPEVIDGIEQFIRSQ